MYLNVHCTRKGITRITAWENVRSISEDSTSFECRSSTQLQLRCCATCWTRAVDESSFRLQETIDFGRYDGGMLKNLGLYLFLTHTLQTHPAN
ncbi:uncharacterized protein LOC143893441 isoform X2 [Temnothorax americanus]|uniref:uncharacterized protein LOC143893441 isoform X2 n=1 Tax=Temnothorax americanus TaxID=1964332 RepID=UPI0040685317